MAALITPWPPRPKAPEKSTVRLSGAFGITLNVTSVNTESVPQEPLRPRTRSTPGDVLHHPPAGLDGRALAIHGPKPQHIVARRPPQNAPGARNIHGRDGADARGQGILAIDPAEIGGLERQLLIMPGECRLHLVKRRARLGRDHQFLRLVKRDPRQLRGRDDRRGIDGPPASRLDRNPQISRGCRPALASFTKPASSTSFRGMYTSAMFYMRSGPKAFLKIERKNLARIEKPSGSKAALTRICWMRSASVY